MTKQIGSDGDNTNSFVIESAVGEKGRDVCVLEELFFK